jgi:hypothetical protein
MTALTSVEGPAIDDAISVLDERLCAVTEADLMVKEVAWNIVGPRSSSLRLLVDREVDALWVMSDALAGAIGALGGTPSNGASHLLERVRPVTLRLGRLPPGDAPLVVGTIFGALAAGHRDAATRLRDLDVSGAALVSYQTRSLGLSIWLLHSWVDADVPSARQLSEEAVEQRQRQAGIL